MRLSDYKNEDAIEVLADMMEPIATIMSQPEVEEAFKSGKPMIVTAKAILKSNSRAVLEMIAALHRKQPEEMDVTIPSLLKDLLDILNDPDIVSLFTSTDIETSSISATASTEAAGK